MDIDALLAKESKKFRDGYTKVFQRRRQWSEFETKTKQLFQKICDKAKNHKLFENLYISNNDSHAQFKNAPPFITLEWGGHPVGMTAIEDTTKWAVERGCALHFSQNVFGNVACILYPFGSDLHSRKEKYYILKVFTSPSTISDKHLEKAVKQMFSYAQISSFVGNPDFSDSIWMLRLNLMSKLRELKYHRIVVPAIKFLAGAIRVSHTGTP